MHKAVTRPDVDYNLSVIQKSIGNTTKANLHSLMTKVNAIVDKHQESSYSEYAAMWEHK